MPSTISQSCPKPCAWCNNWDWKKGTCLISVDCLNAVIMGEAATRFVDIKQVILHSFQEKTVEVK
jgi:pyruvate-formate lyase-activating enzyme